MWYSHLFKNFPHFVVIHTVKGFGIVKSNPMSKETQLRGCRRAERSYSTFKVRRGDHEEITFVQGKEQRLRFVGASAKRYPSAKVTESQVSW